MTEQAKFESLDADALFLLARQANVEVFERAIPIAERIARLYVRKYTWIDQEDLLQDLMYEVPRIMFGYREDNTAGNPWSKYLYWKLHMKAKDILRREDPCGISWPQKKAYPQWHRLGDAAFDGFEPRDHRRDALDDQPEEFKEDIERWREFFGGLPSIPRLRKDRIWDKELHRVRFRGRGVMTIAEWLEDRRRPKQLGLFV